jgi:drug/metabolite transporter (DMT)-like permease
LIYVLLLVLVTAVWGSTFVLVKDAISHYPTLPFLAIRFALAALVMVLVVRRPPGWKVVRVGVPIGIALAAGYLLQTVGLQTASPGNAGLLTGLFVVFTPLLDGVLGAHVPLRTVAAAAVALVGTALLTGSGFALPALGDLLVIGCAFAFAIHIVLLGRWAPGLPPAPLAMVQMFTATLLFGGASLPELRLPPGSVWFAIAVTGVLASALGFLIQTWAQSYLSASRTALVLATEPAWALAAAILLAGQRFGVLQASGAALLLLAILGHEALSIRAARRSIEGRITDR